MLKLKADPRDAGKNLEGVRNDGKIPAVFYGFNKHSTSIAINEGDFNKVWKQAGESTTITLENGAENLDVLIHDVQQHPVTGAPIHVDFLVIDATKEIEVKVPIEFVGESPAAKGGIGMLLKVVHELEIKALPKDLPHNIEVDLSGLANLGDQIHISDLKIPTGVMVITNPEEVVASIVEMKEEVEEVAAPVDLSTIEVTGEKGKKEEEGEAPAEVVTEDK